MKLSKQERIGALIILTLVILALGAFLLIKPKFEEAARSQANLESREKELQSLRARQQTKDQLRTDIEAEYAEGEHLADMFFPELTSYDAHNAFIDFMKQLDFPAVVEEVTVSNPTTETLRMSFYTPTSVSYALKSYVTQNLDTSAEALQNEIRNQALRSALSTSQTIGASKVSFTVSLRSRDDLIAFVDAVNDYKVKIEGTDEEVRKATSVSTLAVEYEEVANAYGYLIPRSTAEIARDGRAVLRELGYEGYEDAGTETPGTEEEMPEVEYPILYTYSETITFLSIERMQDPKPILDAQDGIE